MAELKIAVLDASTLGDDLDLSPLSDFGEVSVYKTTGDDEIYDRIEQADVILINKLKMTPEVLSKAPHLKLICEAATGYDNIDVKYCRERGIAVANVAGYSTHCVAQITFSMVLSLITHLPEYNEFVRSGSYTKSGVANRLSPQFRELYGKTWGIVGYGNIGKQVGKIAEAFGCRIIVNKRTPITDVECVDIDTLCKEADIISIHTPLTPETRGLISADRIALMKKSAILVNTARGAVCDEGAVCEAILGGDIAGFGCDVYSVEPFGVDHPYNKLLNHSNVCLTPHIAWGGYETRVRLLSEICKNIEAFLAGERRSRID